MKGGQKEESYVTAGMFDGLMICTVLLPAGGNQLPDAGLLLPGESNGTAPRRLCGPMWGIVLYGVLNSPAVGSAGATFAPDLVRRKVRYRKRPAAKKRQTVF